MFKTEDIVSDVIFISFNDPKRYADLGINANCGHFLVRGYDHIGVWVSHPGFTESSPSDGYERNTDVVNADEKPQSEIKTKIIEANFLITWDNIKVLMHYPGREGFDFPSEFERHIGFSSNKSKE